MNAALDGQNLFDGRELKIEPMSASRASIERATAGLNGVLSIDLGSRSRIIKQNGSLRAKSRTQMNEEINAISAYMDGDTHTLISSDGRQFDNLRVDAFKVSKERTSGGVVVDYEIVYMQLVV